ncbi:alpha/beta hydrolase [Bacteroidales bacterium OttesenSCG-928-B11]|nr:alpha/beta hydrolase [Bacteroidales bacterium OttesenSCG-928-B11]
MIKRLLFSLFLILNSFILCAQISHDTIQPPKETFAFVERQNQTLFLDKYEPTNKLYDKNPCVIFVFGGGFMTGARDQSYYFPYYRFLMENGYAVIAIDYRLGFKNATFGDKKPGVMDFVNLFEQVIHIAVEDLFAATNYIIAHADEWNIDTSRIVTSGSSAGAITVLQGEYAISSKQEMAKILPSHFNYAGVIGFAGAVLSRDGKLKWSENTPPIQLFHGNADENVPFGKIQVFKTGFFGSEEIAKRLDKYGLPYSFIVEENTDHQVAITPMYDRQGEILSFLDNYVIKKRKLQSTAVMTPLDKPNVKKKFGIIGYVKANFK